MIFFHELGHFYVARKNNVKVLEFSIGMGPKMYQWEDNKGTLWTIRWLPLGGYVFPVSQQLIDEVNKTLDNFENLPELEKVKFEKELEKYSLNLHSAKTLNYKDTIDSKKTYSKIIFSLGGVFMNLIMIWVALFLAYNFSGKLEKTNIMFYQTTEFINNSSQTNSYLVTKVVDDNGKVYNGFEDIDNNLWNDHPEKISVFYNISQENSNSENIISYEESVETFTWNTLTFSYVSSTNQNITFSDKNTSNLAMMYSMTTWESFTTSFIDMWSYFAKGFIYLFYLITPQQNVSSPDIVLISPSNQILMVNFYIYYYLSVMAIFSALLISSNIIPIPPLDGYRFSVYLGEGIFKKKMNPKLSQTLDKVGWFIIIFGTIWILFIASF